MLNVEVSYGRPYVNSLPFPTKFAYFANLLVVYIHFLFAKKCVYLEYEPYYRSRAQEFIFYFGKVCVPAVHKRAAYINLQYQAISFGGLIYPVLIDGLCNDFLDAFSLLLSIILCCKARLVNVGRYQIMQPIMHSIMELCCWSLNLHGLT